MTLIPAYGRDYKSKKDLLVDWDANKDFVVADVFSGACGSKINKEDALKGGIREVSIRYKKLTPKAIVKVIA